MVSKGHKRYLITLILHFKKLLIKVGCDHIFCDENRLPLETEARLSFSLEP